MVLVVVAVFIVCWTPIHIYVLITALVNIPVNTLQTITWHFCIALGYTNRLDCQLISVILVRKTTWLFCGKVIVEH